MNNIDSNNIYCFECNKNYCNACIRKHKGDINNSHLTIEIKDKNIICKLHKKNFNAFCLKCKQNICELCQNHDNYYIEFFKDLYPLKTDIKQFKELSSKTLKNKKENEIIRIKTQFVETFSKTISNYYYINNINNIVRCTSFINNDDNNNNDTKDSNEDIKYINDMKLKKDINNIERKNVTKSMDTQFSNNYISSCWCMKKLNDIQINPHENLELIAMGLSNSKILLLNIVSFQIYQEIKEHSSSVYSLDQYEDDSTFLFSSSNDRSVNVFKLNDKNYYELFILMIMIIQKLEKSGDSSGGEINKVIALSNKLLVTGEHKTITIWKSNNHNKNTIILL